MRDGIVLTQQRGFTCVLCGEKKEGYGHNPAPLSDIGFCCDSCNRKVLRERTKQYRQEKAMLEVTDKLYQICEEFGIADEFVQDVRSYIDEQIKTQTGIDVDNLLK